ncbi:MAG: hypothetical protein KGD74_09900 [Candidatus Lokiarchaeota archaeon]|nr:hypothetical protein [Candidatus Lokiarchaeota archaeon]
MEKICDLHIHSRYSGGTSNLINIKKLAQNCKIKGIDIVGTGDCFHPLWLKEIKLHLEEDSAGLFRLPSISQVKFVLQSEVELLWKQNSDLKKAHFIVLFPNFDKLKDVSEFIASFGNIREEGRPVLNIPPEKFIVSMNNFDKMIEVIPAHIFTPFYGILGNNLHFESLREALGEGFNHIHAVETGLSADPTMIRGILELNNLSIISNSDSHSLNFHRLGREATILDLNRITYRDIIRSIRENKIVKTYEFNPSEGKYYYDGHRSTRHSSSNSYFCSPKRKVIYCPICGNNLTKGVLSRVYELKNSEMPIDEKFQYIIPLLHLIAFVYGGSEYNKKNLCLYRNIVEATNGEFNIWENNTDFYPISCELSEAINKIKSGNYWFIPGYDGVYGKLQLGQSINHI